MSAGVLLDEMKNAHSGPDRFRWREFVSALDFVLAKPVVQNLEQFLAFFANQFVKGPELAGRQALHRYRIAFEAA